jgi:hypothetical protein
MRTCSNCKTETDDFYSRGNTCRPCVRRDRRSNYHADPDKQKKLSLHRFHKADKETKRNWQLKNKYGKDLNWYKDLLKKQDGVCAICKGPPNGRGAINDQFYVDHDHETGQIRELLCHYCNLMIGYAKENGLNLKSAINYLEKWGK